MNNSNSSQRNPIIEAHGRQVHLDFHTSPHIPDVGAEFDATQFAQTFKRAHVNSVTVFAKCHHGMCYYPTTTGTPHPALNGRDLLGEQIEALHREGIRCPIYTTIAWEEDVARRFPQWRQRRADGTFARAGAHPGAWWFVNYLHPDYQDYIEAHLRELVDRYGDAVDGFFLDILFMERASCWSEESVKFRTERGLLGRDAQTYYRFDSASQQAFSERFTPLIQGLLPDATIFYNSPNRSFVDGQAGIRAFLDSQTHYEIESLPSGSWGYYHFPRLARQAMAWDKSWFAMTGRFQKMWGDFGGIKPQAALEYECFRAQALGGGNSVGDQLPPRGRLDPAAYDLIGAVYAQCAEAEPFYAGSEPLPQIGILSASHPALDEGASNKSAEGVVQMCEETHYDAVVLDDQSDLSGYELLLLPDTTLITPDLRDNLRAYYQDGGQLVLSYGSGFDARGQWALDFLPLEFAGETEKYPTYWRAREDFDAALARSDRVFYQSGMNLRANGEVRVLVERVLPYFKRDDLHFCSHQQTPPVAEPDRFPAVVAGERFVYFADPIFREYRQSGNLVVRDVWRRVMANLIAEPHFGAGLPTTVLCVPRLRGDDLILTLLHYVPLRKALDIDVIEERMSFAGETLRLPRDATSARVFGGEELERTDDGFILPPVKGRLLIEVPSYFA